MHDSVLSLVGHYWLLTVLLCLLHCTSPLVTPVVPMCVHVTTTPLCALLHSYVTVLPMLLCNHVVLLSMSFILLRGLGELVVIGLDGSIVVYCISSLVSTSMLLAVIQDSDIGSAYP